MYWAMATTELAGDCRAWLKGYNPLRSYLSRGDPRPRISLAGRKRVAIALSATVRIENAIEQHLAGLLKLIRWVAGIGVALLILYLAFRFLGLMH